MSDSHTPAITVRVKPTAPERLVMTASDRLSRRELLAGMGVAVGVAGCVESTEDGPYDGYLASANGFEDVTDETDSEQVTVQVGAGEEGLAFGPAAVQVTPETTVVWEWTGKGGRHNVVAEEGSFQSPYYIAPGQTFEQTFEEPAVYKYLCEPHETQGMLGVIEVVER